MLHAVTTTTQLRRSVSDDSFDHVLRILYEPQLSRSLRPLQTTCHTAPTATELLQSITVLLLWQWRELAQSPAAITFSLVLCWGRFFTVDYSSGEFNITHGCSTRNFHILIASGHFAICALSCLPAAPVIVASRWPQGPPGIATWIFMAQYL